ncbi:hypothetical protein ACQ4PT_038461 [Festuca glaucescens]
MDSLQLDSTIVLLSLVFVVSCLIIVRSFWSGRKGRLPPSPPTLPIIGNLHQLSLSYLHRRLQALAQRHGPVFLLRLGSMPAIVVSSASVAETVLKTKDNVFCGRSQNYTARGLLYGCRDIALSPYGEQWRQSRRIAVEHMLNVKRVDSFRALRVQEVAGFVQQIRDACVVGKDRGVVNVSELIVSLTNTVILKTSFGNKLRGVEPAMFSDVMKELIHLVDMITVSDLFPRLRWLDWATGLDARVKKTAAKLDGILEGLLSRRRDGDDEVPGLLDDLLSMVKDGDLDRIQAKALILVSLYSILFYYILKVIYEDLMEPPC